MPYPLRALIWPCSLAVAAALVAGCSWNQAPSAPPEAPLPLAQTLSVGERVSLRIAGVRGSITVRTGKEGALTVRAGPAVQEAASAPAPEAAALTLAQEGDAVTLAAPLPARGWLGWVQAIFRPAPLAPDLQVTLAVPEATSVTLREVAGTVTVAAIKGSVSLQGDEVTASLTHIGGAVEVDIRGGTLSLDGGGGGGPCRFALGTATLRARRLSCQTLEARGERDLRLEDSDVAQGATLTTRDGEVQIARLQAEGLEARTERGHLLLRESTIAGEAALENGAGEVAASRANAGTLRVEARQGTAALSEVQGNLAVDAPRGRVVLRRVLARSLAVRSGGEVLLSGDLLPAGGHRIQTSGGAVTLYLRREASLRVQADIGAGALTVAPELSPDAAAPVRGRSVREINGGAVVLEVITGGGDVMLKVGDPLF